MKFFVKDFSETLQARVVMQINDDVFYCGIKNQPFSCLLYPCFEKVGGILAYICPSILLSFHPSICPLFCEIFHQRFLHNHAS